MPYAITSRCIKCDNCISHCPTGAIKVMESVTEHLQRFADAAFTKDSEKTKWFKTAPSYLKSGKITALLEDMNVINSTAHDEVAKS